MAEWSFLTNHAQALLCIAHDPGVRLIDIAAALGITERSAFTAVRTIKRPIKKIRNATAIFSRTGRPRPNWRP